MERDWMLSLLRLGTRQECPTSPLLFNMEVLASATDKKKINKIKIMLFGKEEIKLSLFPSDIIYNRKCQKKKNVPKQKQNPLIEAPSELSKVTGSEINTQTQLHFCILTANT